MAKRAIKTIFFVFCVFAFASFMLYGVCDHYSPDKTPGYGKANIPDAFSFSYAHRSGNAPKNESKTASGVIPQKKTAENTVPKNCVILGGDICGMRIKSEGVLVTAVSPESPAEKAGIQKGDIIKAVGGAELSSVTDMISATEKSKGKALEFSVLRKDEIISLTLVPEKSANGRFKAGMWVRDGAAGIGTVTFIDPATGSFGALGHGISDADTGVIFPVASGNVYKALFEGVTKGKVDRPGEIRGALGKSTVGTVETNTGSGVFGTLKDSPRTISSESIVPVASPGEIREGKAKIYCTVSPAGKEGYDIEIEKLCDPDGKVKNFIVRVTDPALLEKTGGIVQGMSGSPVVQNGKLVGAVTHVLLSDPTRGYGIFIENMLETAQQNKLNNAA